MEKTKNYIIKQVASNKLSQEEAKSMLLELKTKPSRADDDIAIIGMACRFPQADNPEEFWNNLINGVVSIRDLPEKRKEDFYTVLSNTVIRKTMINADIKDEDISNKRIKFIESGYLDEVDKFDAGFFHIPPREAKFIDPMQRVFMEAAWEAIEDAGYGGKKVQGTNTGVYVGRDNTNSSIYSIITEQDQMHLTGSWAGILATRISYAFDFKGPGMVIDTACSSGATAIHEACKALKNKECDYALAGGIQIASRPNINGENTNMSMVESKDSKVRTFDKNANGTVWGEGVGVLFLKPLSKAVEDGDNIHAVIKGSAINNDGTSNGITAPNAEAQEEVIIQAWKNAKVNPETISYVEAHATGTVLGDPIEIKGLSNALARFTDKKQFCGIGSAKPNIGHLVAASGPASLMKVVLAMKKEKIPAVINFDEPNPYIDFCNSPIFVNDSTREWKKSDVPRRAGVSSFGFSGTNCHIILEEAPEVEKSAEAVIDGKPQIFTISARSENVLEDYVKKYTDFFSKNANNNLKNVCFTANTGRGHFSYRIAIVAGSFDELKEKISHIAQHGFNKSNENGVFFGQHKITQSGKKSSDAAGITEEQMGRITLSASNLIQRISGSESYTENDLYELSRLYVEGAEIDWDNLYKGKKLKRVSLPAYPFERVRLWANPREFGDMIFGTQKDHAKSKYPLYDEHLESFDSHIFTTYFEVKRHWVLSDHRVIGNYVVPGTTYLEMAIEASSEFYQDKNLVLKNVIFITPLVVNEGEQKEVQTIVKPYDGHLDFIVASKDLDGNWAKHAEGSVSVGTQEGAKRVDISEIKARCSTEIISDSNDDNGPFGFGPRWNSGRKAYIGDNETLGYFELPAEFIKDLDEYRLHPSLMDNAINMANTSIGEGLYLPLTYKVLKTYGSTPGKLYSHLRRRSPKQENPESLTFDVTLMTEDGLVFAEVEDYTVKRVNEAASTFRKLSGKGSPYYEMSWVQEDLKAGEQDISGLKILVLKSKVQTADELVKSLKDSGASVTEVELGDKYQKTGENRFVIQGIQEDYNKLIEDINIHEYSKIVHMLNIYGTVEKETFESLQSKKKNGLFSMYYIAKTVSSKKLKNNLQMLLISDYASEVNGEEEAINPYNAAFMGIGKVVGAENDKLSLRCLDIDKNTCADDLLNEIKSDSKKYMAAYRNGKRYIEMFRRMDIEEKAAVSCEIKAEGIYLITGGMGGLGLEIGKYLSSKGKVNLCLVSRSQFPEREDWDGILSKNENRKVCKQIEAIKAMEASGASIVCCSADVTNFDAMKVLIDELRGKYGRVSGIIHAAGVAGNGFIINRSEDTFKSVINPKMDGAWILDNLTRSEEMDFFISFSSIASILGGAGQGDYTAANSYLDSFSFYRNKQGKRTITINWPAWKETGMAVEFGADKDDIFKTISTADALSAFEEVLGRNVGRIVIAEPDYGHEVFQNETELPFKISTEISAAVKRLKDRAGNNNIAKSNTQLADVKLKGRGDGNYTGTERIIGQIWGTLLGMEEIDINDDFFAMGGNSLLAVRMETEMEKSNLIIEYSDINSHPTIYELAEYLDKGENASDIVQKTESSDDDNIKAFEEKASEDKVTASSVKQTGSSDELKVLDSVEPFNEIIYRGCFYSALFPVVRHFNKSVLSYMANEIGIYGNREYMGVEGVNVGYLMKTPIFEVSERLGIHVESKPYTSTLTQDIVRAISADKLVIVCVDCFYESIRKDTYQKTHWPHCLLIYGFNEREKTFDILEHRHSGSLVYEKRTIGYSDLVNAYNGFLENFRNIDISEIEFASMKVHDKTEFPSYYEFSSIEGLADIEDEDDLHSFKANFIEVKNEVFNSFKYYEEFYKQFEAAAADEGAIKESAALVLELLNNLINAKQAMNYRNSRLVTNYSEIEGIILECIDLLSFIRARIARLLYTSRYKRETFLTCTEKLDRAIKLEYEYYNKLCAMMGI
ncbi:MAG: SDR family NAD(P)-dependent oxidoreductase [Clostridia bacterium]|nr:SDR family NAD(P)-dependent oxidoreductase [Clostridia bacterium]